MSIKPVVTTHGPIITNHYQSLPPVTDSLLNPVLYHNPTELANLSLQDRQDRARLLNRNRVRKRRALKRRGPKPAHIDADSDEKKIAMWDQMISNATTTLTGMVYQHAAAQVARRVEGIMTGTIKPTTPQSKALQKHLAQGLRSPESTGSDVQQAESGTGSNIASLAIQS